MKTINSVQLVGSVVEKQLAFTGTKHDYEEKFYELKLNVQRTSGTYDNIPLICSEKYLFDVNVEIGTRIQVTGSIHSVRHLDEETQKKYRTMYVYVNNISVVDESVEDENKVELCGSIFRYTRSRVTKETQRSITDMTIITDRPNGRKDYVACIAWGRNATLAGKRKENDVVKLIGRLQSRTKKKNNSDEIITRHEVSIINMEVVEQAPPVQEEVKEEENT